MKCSSVRLWTLFLLLLAAGGQARADYLNWSYSSNPNVPGVTAGATAATGGATVTLTDYTNHAGGASIPVIAYVTSSALSTPITFSPSGSPPTTYTFGLTLTDNATHDSRTLNFAGSIAGTLSATTSTLVNTLSPVGSNSVTFDGHKYTVSIPSVTLAAPTSPQQNIMASVVVSNVNSGGTGNGSGNGGGNQHGVGGGGSGGISGGISGVPEPTTLVLGGLGFTLMGLGYWRKPRRRQ